ncbi:MAG: DNA repair protein RecN [Legionellaceae bacterium]
MLRSLCIENFAIVSTLELDFDEGMTAFTGETGAGKSIMIDALALALGGRSDPSVVRKGAEKCDIHAYFTFDEASAPAEWLNAHDLTSNAKEVWLRRVIYAEGRSKSYIDGQPFPLQKVKELSHLLVDIHGQHEHQRLLHHATHREQLDTYGNHEDLLKEVQTCHQTCQTLKQTMDELKLVKKGDGANLLAYQLDELEALNLQAGELDTLHEEHQLLHHAKAYLEQILHLKACLAEAQDGPTLSMQLHQVNQLLKRLPAQNPNIKNALLLIQNAQIQCDEALDEIEKFEQDVQLDPERLATVETRMSLLHQTARKYQIDPNQLLTHFEQLKDERQRLEGAEEQLHALNKAFDVAQTNYTKAALALRASRTHHAKKLAEEITQTIRQLGIPKGYIDVVMTPTDTLQAHGLDKVEYHVCTNPGLAPDTLGKIASGGELSRISLSIQLITAQRGSTPTLFFDEIDVGIGGATAALVGQLLRSLGERLQVFCVTHQAQVASAAHHHFVVEKYTQDEQTFSQVNALTSEEKIHEIARMLGGLTITEETRSHARALIQESRANEHASILSFD